MKAGDQASRVQAIASDPAISAFVPANAGSGKTHVLVNRVVRLLLAEIDDPRPERILCLTYTRAAAAEMSRRLFDMLGEWVALDDEKLIGVIHLRTGHAVFPTEKLDAARRLFTRALETPGGLKIQTIHAFCERLLQRFPVEAGVVPGFEVLDERLSGDLLDSARAAELAEIAAAPHTRDGDALRSLIAFTNSDGFCELLKVLVGRRADLREMWQQEDGEGVERALARLDRAMGLNGTMTFESIMAEARAGIDPGLYRAAAATLTQHPSATNDKQVERIARVVCAMMPAEAFEALKALVLTGSDEPKAPSNLISRRAAVARPEVEAFLLAEQDRVVRLFDRERAVRMRKATGALFVVADRIIQRYEREKRRRGAYDYDDLIARTGSLLANSDDAQWVLYKLDGGIDHILIDEAQDTSPEQWRIIRTLADEFFAGEGAHRGATRTLFAVGDPKQSIYSFQGANPEEFVRMLQHFTRKITEARQRFETVPFTVSFRSTQAVLSAVDAVFAGPDLAVSLTGSAADQIVHQAVREGHAGLIEMWPALTRKKPEKDPPWRAPREEEAEEHPRIALARRIAATIRRWLDTGEELVARGRPIRPDDILILLRTRSTFMDALVRALKQAGIPVAGSDRLLLARHIAVQDLMALGSFVLLPQDDLKLAALLKSPLVARDDGPPIEDEDLFDLAYGRGGASLWETLKRAVRDGKPYGQAQAALSRWLNQAAFASPFDFFSGVLVADGRRRMLLERLGSEAADPIDAFLTLALDYEMHHPPSLAGFLGFLEASDAEIKRDMDASPGEVRVMTVHGAKGLEANIVFLPDTCDIPDGQTDSPILVDESADGPVPVWRLTKPQEPMWATELKMRHRARAIAEYHRLLYVAMTRARDRLYVCGYTSNKEAKEGCWHRLVLDALRTEAQTHCDAQGEVTCWRIEQRQGVAPQEKASSAAPPPQPTEPPLWAMTPPAEEAGPARWLNPSRLIAGAAPHQEQCDAVLSPLAEGVTDRFRRGRLIHRLLQALPDVAPAHRAAAARRYLNASAGDLPETEREALTGEVLAVLDHPDFAPLFAEGSLAEVPVAAFLPAGDSGLVALSGQIDRLVATDCEVLIADFKTNRPVPADEAAADPAYIAQLAAYRAALMRIYPDRRVRCALVWTDGPKLMEIPPDRLDRYAAGGGP